MSRTYKEQLEYQTRKLTTIIKELNAASDRVRGALALLRQAQGLLDEELEKCEQGIRGKRITCK